MLDPGLPSERNAVRIISVTPAAAIPGTPAEFTIKVAYSLVEALDATFCLNVNLQQANEFQRAGARYLTAGSGMLICTIVVSPPDYGNLGDFTFVAHIQKANNQVVACHEHSVVIDHLP